MNSSRKKSTKRSFVKHLRTSKKLKMGTSFLSSAKRRVSNSVRKIPWPTTRHKRLTANQRDILIFNALRNRAQSPKRNSIFLEEIDI
jgi:hypothetical protein